MTEQTTSQGGGINKENHVKKSGSPKFGHAKKIAAYKRLPKTDTHHFTHVQDIISSTNGALEEAMYISDDIFIPKKKNIGRCYRSDFTFKNKQEAEKIDASVCTTYKDADFFVYNNRTKEMLPFKKNDYLVYEHGYCTFDGVNYLFYDNNGNEIGRDMPVYTESL